MNSRTSPEAQTRWQELKETLSLVMEAATIFDNDGIDLYFLNRSGVKNVHEIDTLNKCFSEDPHGRTPLVGRLESLMKEYRENDKKVLFLIATDGCPSDTGSFSGASSPTAALEMLMKKRENDPKLVKQFAMSFIMCTENNDDVAAYDRFDRGFTGVDVHDDFYSEREQVRKAWQGKRRFTQGDWLVKILLGGIVQKIDDMDEPPPKHLCCVIL